MDGLHFLAVAPLILILPIKTGEQGIAHWECVPLLISFGDQWLPLYQPFVYFYSLKAP